MHEWRRSYFKPMTIFLAALCLFVAGTAMPENSSGAEETAAGSDSDVYTLDRTIQEALTANISARISAEETQAALYRKKSSKSAFFPTFSATYLYQRNDEATTMSFPAPMNLDITTTPEELYNFSATVTQPLFTGMAILNQYKMAELGLNQAQIQEAITRQDIISNAKLLFFNLLKISKLSAVAEQSVTLLEAHRNVAENFYKVGMSPLNDLLKAEVELSNSRQALVSVQNNLAIAEANLNLLLRRPINAPLEPKDVSHYSVFDTQLEHCLEKAQENRLEMQIADIAVELREKELALTRKDYYPTVSLQGKYSRMGDQWDVDGFNGSDPASWQVQAVATWTFWEWGKTYFGSEEKRRRISQAKLQKVQIHDRVIFEVKQAYLNVKESEKNIATVEKAVAQAQESHRITEERYNEQMATSTDVLDAQTLLTRTRTNFYNALYDFEISKAALDRAMGLPLQSIGK